jgi:hypothetical protein
MAETVPQRLEKHARTDPKFHYFVFPVSILNLIYAVYLLIQTPGFMTGWTVLMAIVLVVLVFTVRVYPLRVQDRVIRLEERLRMQSILPDPLKPNISRLTEAQIIALRFASDAELAGLVEAAVSENLSQKEIKKRIKSWRPDYFRV